MDAAKQDNVGVCFSPLDNLSLTNRRRSQQHPVTRHLIVMRENNSVPFALELLQLFCKINTSSP